MTWMHVMNGNLSAEGLTKDLEALADAGVGGALLFTLGRGIPPGPVPFNTDEFRRIVVHGAREAERLGLTFGLHNCDGWSSSGGPWVPIEESMKRIVWSETVLAGGAVDVTLPTTPYAEGFSRSVAVMAVPATATELALSAMRPRVTISPNGAEAPGLVDADVSDDVRVNPQPGVKNGVWVQLDYAGPFTARSIYIEHSARSGQARLEVSDDGVEFRPAMDIRKSRTGKNRWIAEQSFPPITARSFRILFDGVNNGLGINWVELLPWERLDRWPALTGMAFSELADRDSIQARTDFVRLADVLDLSDDFHAASGRLQTTLPPGHWRVLRFGFTTTAAVNQPSSKTGIGWECDKFDAAALEHHFAAYVGRIVAESNALGPHALKFSEIDSYEMGGQNWTDEMPALFAARAGYELRPFLPLLAGVPLENAATTRAVLADFVGVGNGLMADNYFQRFTELCHENGLKSYLEPYGNGIFNGFTIGGLADIPMGEFWMSNPGGNASWFTAPVSAAHTYGKPVISAESFTSWADLNWKVHPWLLKPSGDNAWAHGINEFMFHRFTHQPNTRTLPGMTMDNIGSHLDRTQTWWANAGKAWMSYLQRGSYLLRQGVPQADVLMLAGEETPVNPRAANPLPSGYLIDFCDAHVVTERVRVSEGQLVLPEGTRYGVLSVRPHEPISTSTLRGILALVEAGATLKVDGPPSPLGYRDLTTDRAEFDSLVKHLWGDASSGWREVGHGRVAVGLDWPTVFAALELGPDLQVNGAGRTAFQHRRVGNDDLYYCFHDGDEPLTMDVLLRVGQKRLERWNAEDGSMHALAGVETDATSTRVSLTLNPHDSVFLVARPAGAGEAAPVATAASPSVATLAIAGPWAVRFTDPFGETFVRRFTTLSDWAESSDDALRHFSGTAVYTTTFALPTASGRVELDLGDVQIAAEVLLNGQSVRTLWRPPFVVDLTDAVQSGPNTLEVRVTNLWTNRLIGDAALPDETGYTFDNSRPIPDWYARNQAPPGPRRTFTTYDFHRTDRKLLPSGLLGPVVLRFTP